MRALAALCFALILPFTAAAAPVSLTVNDLPYTRHELRIDSDDFPKYTMLAAYIGLDYDWVYGYREFVLAKEANNIASGAVSGGPYEYLLLSTGGNGDDPEDDIRAQRVPLHWEMLYLGNHDMTVIWAVKSDGQRSYVRLLKLSRGRVPDLHLR
jgi:hypothetical protein